MFFSNRYTLVSAIGAVVLFLDQITKFWVEATIPRWGTGMTVIPGFFDIVHVLNRGAAFGFLNRSDIQWQTYFFIGASALAVVLIFHLVRTVNREDKPLFIGLGLILGGAMGNLIDRIRLGEVVDFLDFYIGPHHWPAFNIADMAITTGCFFLLVSFYIRKRDASNSR
ncbi:MAG: signal peptidase II [Deltaproteobacteria bacterium]|nr:signal peptidase II [Deltaproteobacteria bacterium]